MKQHNPWSRSRAWLAKGSGTGFCKDNERKLSVWKKTDCNAVDSAWIIIRDSPDGSRLGESGSWPSAADRVLEWTAIEVKECITARWQLMGRITGESFGANLIEAASEDICTNNSDGAVNGGRADRPCASVGACKKEPARYVAHTDWS